MPGNQDVIGRLRAHNLHVLSSSRAAHVFRVADKAAELAESCSADKAKCITAALAHDLMRESDTADIMKKAQEDGLPIAQWEQNHPLLLHGRAAAVVLREEYSIVDPSVLTAVRYHTTGHPDFDKTGMVLYAADYLEPGRKHLDDAIIRETKDLPLNKLVLYILSRELDRAQKLGYSIAPVSVQLKEKIEHHVQGGS